MSIKILKKLLNKLERLLNKMEKYMNIYQGSDLLKTYQKVSGAMIDMTKDLIASVDTDDKSPIEKDNSTLEVKNKPIIFIERDRYGGQYSGYEYILYSDIGWKDSDFNSDAIGCKDFWEEYNYIKAEYTDIELLENYGVMSGLCGIDKLHRQVNLNANIIRQYLKSTFPDNKHFLFVDSTYQSDLIEAVKNINPLNSKTRFVYIDVNYDDQKIIDSLMFMLLDQNGIK